MVNELGPKNGPYKKDFEKAPDTKAEVQSGGTTETRTDAKQHVDKVTGQ